MTAEEFDIAESLNKRFYEFREQAAKFSAEIISISYPFVEHDLSRSADRNLIVAGTMFGKWSLEILTILYTLKSVRFGELRKSLEVISSRVLSHKLKVLENKGLIQRTVLSTRPPRVEYTLTDKGLTVAKLGEPVFLFLRLKEGLLIQPKNSSAVAKLSTIFRKV